MMKRALSLLLVLVLLVGLFPGQWAFAADGDDPPAESPDPAVSSEPAEPTDSEEPAESTPIPLLEHLADAADPDEGEKLVERFGVSLKAGAKAVTTEDGVDYVWTADNNYSDHAFVYRISYAMSGAFEYEAGKVEIVIPKTILLNRNGRASDNVELAIPAEDEVEPDDQETTFVYREIRDGENEYIAIYNRLPITAAESGYIEVSYSTQERTYEYADYDPENLDTAQSGNPNPKNGSNPFWADLYIYQDGAEGEDGVWKHAHDSEQIPVYIDTTAKVRGTEKRVPTYYTSWQNKWGTKPADADNYYYLVWEIRTVITDTTQPYDFSLEDVFTAQTGQEQPEVVGYQLQGTNTFRPEGVARNLKTDYQYGRYDYVLTRHSKDAYDAIIADAESYTLKNTITATVTPTDRVDNPSSAKAKRDWTFEKQTFTGADGHFNAEKKGLDYADNYVRTSEYIRRFTMTDFVEGHTDKISDLAFYTYVHGNPGRNTVLDGEAQDNPDNYWKAPVNYTLEDYNLRLRAIEDSEYTDLTTGDYQIDSINLNYQIKDATFSETEKDFVAKVGRINEEDVVTVFVQVSGATEPAAEGEEALPSWTQVGVYHPKTNSWSDLNNTYVASTSGKAITFNNNEGALITGYKLSTDSAHYYTLLGAKPHVSLLHSDTVDEITGKACQEDAQRKIVLQNTVKSKVTRGDQSLANFRRSAMDYVVGVVRDGELTKTISGYQNNKVRRQYVLTWEINANESYQTEGGKRAYVTQDGGVIYDLLPQGAVYKPGSVAVYADDEALTSGYSVRTIQNYNGTGRTMLVVKVDTPADKYRMNYSTIHTWDAISEYSTHVINDVAYETGNTDIGGGQTRSDWEGGDGLPIDLGSLSNAEPGEKQFLYTTTNHDINALTAASLGLYKKVMSAQDSVEKYETTTYLNGDYSYHIRFAATDSETEARDLIVFDTLENYRTSGSYGVHDSDWHGILQSVDVSQAQLLGAAPVVWYSTDADFAEYNTFHTFMMDQTQVDANYDFAADGHWVKASDYTGDLADVKAFAVDLRKDTNGETFYLQPNNALGITVYMRAPAEDTSGAEDPITYNNIHLFQTTVRKTESGAETLPHTEMIYQDFTRNHLRVAGGLELHKVDSTAPETVIQGVEFQLQGTSDYGKYVDLKQTTNRSGVLRFEDVERGTYTLQEINGVPDYQQDHTQMTVRIDNAGVATIENPPEHVTQTAPGVYTVTNEPRVHGDLSFVKRGLIDGKDNTRLLPGVRFKLSGTSAYGNDIVMYAVSDESGVVSFENVEQGSYTLTEVETVDGYIRSTTVYTVICESTGMVVVKLGDEEVARNEDGDYELFNEPYHSFQIWKVDAMNSAPIEGATFRLTGTSDLGTAVDMTAESNSNGIAGFENLEPGDYILRETATDEHHILDNTSRAVHVSSDGTVTVQGLKVSTEEANGAAGFHIWPNQRAYNGVITITKEWADGDAPDHPFPVVHLDTDWEQETLKTAMVNHDVWKSLRTNENSILRTTTEFKRNTSLTREEVLAKPGVKQVGTMQEPHPEAIYMWEEDGVCYWWSDAAVVYFGGTGDASMLPNFYGCSNFRSIDMTGLDTSKRTNLQELFRGCKNLTDVNISGLDTSNVTSMLRMFYDCQQLKSLDVSNFDTSNVTHMGAMFYNCLSLSTLDLSNFDTSSVTNMGSMFEGCNALSDLDISNFDTSNVTTMGLMFQYCKSLPELDLSHFNTQQVTNMAHMFHGCSSLASVDVSSFNTSAVTSMESMFQGCSKLTSLDLTAWNSGESNTASVKSFKSMFNECRQLQEIQGIENFKTDSATDLSYMFYNCLDLTELHLNSWNTENVKDLTATFAVGFMVYQSYSPYRYSKLRVLEVANWNTQNVTTLANTFDCLDNLESLDVKNWNTSKVTNLNKTFERLGKLTSLDLSLWDVSKVTSMTQTFRNDSRLTYLPLDNWQTTSLRSMNSTFIHCSSLAQMPVEDWDVSKVTDFSSAFSNCYGITSIDLSNWNTSRAQNMSGIFGTCTSLRTVDLSGWNTATVTDMSSMFWKCTVLKTVYVGDGWTTENVTASASMFAQEASPRYLTQLEGQNGTHVDIDHTNKEYARIDNAPDAPGYFSTHDESSTGDGSAAVMPAASGTGSLAKATRFIHRAPESVPHAEDAEPLAQTLADTPTSGAPVADNQTSKSVMYEGSGDPSEVFDQWIDNGDGTWTYRFHVYDGAAQDYYVWEGALAGYETENGSTNPVVVHYDPENPAGNQASITNTPVTPAPETGGLTVSKRLENASPSDLNTYFHFTITFTGVPDGQYGDLKITNGQAAFVLRGGDSISFTNLPAGATYRVDEREANQGMTTTVNGTVTSLARGTIVAEQTSAVTFVNEFPIPKVGKLAITKTVEAAEGITLSDYDLERTFAVDITFTGDIPDGAYGDLYVKDGKAVAQVAHGKTVTLTDLPAGVTYSIAEQDYTTEGFTAAYEGETGVIVKDETQNAAVTNTRTEPEPTGGFTITKTVDGKDLGDEFTFDVSITGMRPGTGFTVDETAYTADSGGAAHLRLTLKNGDSSVFEGLPVGASYDVTEAASNYFASYQITDGSMIVGAGENTRVNLALSTVPGEITKNGNPTIAFTNRTRTFPLTFSKIDTERFDVPGATLQLIDADSNEVVSKWVTEEGTTAVNVPAGSYILRETAPPEGFAQAADIAFQVAPDGTITGLAKTDIIEMVDPYTEISISKRDGYGEPVADAHLQILKGSKQVVDWYTNSTGDATFVGDLDVLTPYVLHEFAAPDGYALAPDVPFVLGADGKLYLSDSFEVDAATGAVTITGEAEEANVIVMNDYRGVVLPQSGSNDALLVTLAGALTVTTGALVLLRRRKKEN